MLTCSSGHEDIVCDSRRNCPLCLANQSLAETLAEVSRLEGRVEELEREISSLHLQLDRAYGACQH